VNRNLAKILCVRITLLNAHVRVATARSKGANFLLFVPAYSCEGGGCEEGGGNGEFH
jgi:hypothetical protein